MSDRHWGLSITHIPQRYPLTPKDVSILATLLECRDLIRRARCATVDYDDCDSPIDEIRTLCVNVDRAIAGYIEHRFHCWAWDKEDDKDFIKSDWLSKWSQYE